MATKSVYDDDMPEMTDEILAEFHAPLPKVVVIAEDLKLGPAEVKPYDRNAWIKKFGPKPPGLGMRAMDFLIIGMFAVSAMLILQAWAWVLFS